MFFHVKNNDEKEINRMTKKTNHTRRISVVIISFSFSHHDDTVKNIEIHSFLCILWKKEKRKENFEEIVVWKSALMVNLTKKTVLIPIVHKIDQLSYLIFMWYLKNAEYLFYVTIIL